MKTQTLKKRVGKESVKFKDTNRGMTRRKESKWKNKKKNTDDNNSKWNKK